MTLPDGLYDLLLTDGLAARLEASNADIRPLGDGAAELLADVRAVWRICCTWTIRFGWT